MILKIPGFIVFSLILALSHQRLTVVIAQSSSHVIVSVSKHYSIIKSLIVQFDEDLGHKFEEITGNHAALGNFNTVFGQFIAYFYFQSGISSFSEVDFSKRQEVLQFEEEFLAGD